MYIYLDSESMLLEPLFWDSLIIYIRSDIM